MKRLALRRRIALALVSAVVVPLTLPVVTAGAASEPAAVDAPRFREVGRVPVVTEPPTGSTPGDVLQAQASGWLILDPGSRRGYTVVEGTIVTSAPVKAATVIRSFDLDTLRPLRTVVVNGIPVDAGPNSGGQGLANGGDVVHAVDSVAKRVYLAMSDGTSGRSAGGQDGRRLLSYVLVLDEVAFDRDPGHAFGAFALPATPDHQRLKAHHLFGMAVSRRHVAAHEPGKLLAVFASPNPLSSTDNGVAVAFPLVWDHTLAQWDPGAVPMGQAPPVNVLAPGAQPVTGDWAQVLTPCVTAPLTSASSDAGSSVYAKNFQWGILATGDAVYTGCQSSAGSGAVVRMPVDKTTGFTLGTDVLGAEPQRLVSLGKPIGDVLVDEGGGRLLVRSFGGGATWWVFDAEQIRFTGAIAVHVKDSQFMAAGVDSGSGRLYTLTPDTCATRAGGGMLPVRGGLKLAEARLDPVPAAENVVPDLAYNSHWRVHVDSVTRRVFVRRGVTLDSLHLRHPECDLNKRESRSQELFYRVYEDRFPLAEPPSELDDSTLTTDVDEAPGLTQASYLGSGSGYGLRTLLIGGLDAPTDGALTTTGSLCGRGDREALVGSVGKVEVSDQSTLAEAAGLDADAGTQENLGDPFSRCRPQAPSNQIDGERNTDDLNECHGNLDVREGSFDQSTGVDGNGDGCDDRDGDNRYAASCLGTETATDPGFDDGRQTNRARDGFEAKVDCDEKQEKATGSATGSLSSTSPQPADPVKVARSSSTVEVVRKAGTGVTVKVDSVARGVEITGVGTIGVVRAEATSTATGRDGRASATFTRTICDVDIGGVVVRGCLGEGQVQAMVKALNDALGGRGEARLRSPDAALARGTAHGYLAALQRDRKERFADQALTKDLSLAVPGLEIVMYRGEGGEWGAGRQVFQLAGAQASTSYGITCTYGRKVDGSCAQAGEEFAAFSDLPGGADDGSVTTITETLPGETAVGVFGSPKENLVTRLFRAVPRAIAEALRMLFNNPRELGLLAALWALLYAPCYLGDRRRAVREISLRRLSAVRQLAQ